MVLILLLHYVHDLPLSAVGSPSWYRYADNLVYLVQDVSHGQRVLSMVGDHLRKVGLSLKGTDGIVDLTDRGSTIELLGFKIQRTSDGQLAYHPGNQATTLLENRLVESLGTPYPEEAAQQILQGWVQVYGPAYQRQEPVLRKLMNLTTHCGFREIDVDSLNREVQKSWKRWRRLLRKSRYRRRSQ